MFLGKQIFFNKKVQWSNLFLDVFLTKFKIYL